jgi:peptidoglycan/xylan/chitin deacetylase (PgdA/CDA1 family)
MTAQEVAAAADVVDFGAHTHTHCILGNENRERRDLEIRTSIDCVREWTGKPVRLFSYPNGQRGDFDDDDKTSLRSKGIEAAVTGFRGANPVGAELLHLRRYPIGLYHDAGNFGAEVTGFRSVVLNLSRRSGL